MSPFWAGVLSTIVVEMAVAGVLFLVALFVAARVAWRNAAGPVKTPRPPAGPIGPVG